MVFRKRMKSAWDWLVTKWNWPGAAALAGVILLLVSPVVWSLGGAEIFWVFLMLPIYMLHQLEEHAGDRFRIFATEVVGHGVEVLSRRAVWVINSAGVWGVDLVALYLAVFVNPGWGLVAMYLPLVNAIAHVAQGIALRRYNPGLVSAVVLFIPLAGWGLAVVSRGSEAGWAAQAVGLGTAVVIHAAIIVHVKRRLLSAKRA